MAGRIVMKRSNGSTAIKRRQYLWMGLAFATIILLINGMSLYAADLHMKSKVEVKASQTRHHVDPIFRPEVCNENQREIVKKHLPSDKCEESAQKEWRSSCSISYATRCPNPTWVKDFYKNDPSPLDREESTFLGIVVGCKNGLKAINTMRMGTFDPIFDSESWLRAVKDFDTDSRCNEKSDNSLFDLNLDSTGRLRRDGEMYCIEASPLNYNKLNDISNSFGLESKGFFVTQAAIAEKDGTTFLPSEKGVGCTKKSDACVEVNEIRLDSYVEKYVKSTGKINHLTIDVEGTGVSALLSASKIFDRIEYLEFQYNLMGDRSSQNLSDIIEMLNNRRFTCYWVGNNEVWRISDCIQKQNTQNFWSNIGCAHRTIAPQILKNMEKLFEETLTRKTGDLNYVMMEYDRPDDKKYIEDIRQRKD